MHQKHTATSYQTGKHARDISIIARCVSGTSDRRNNILSTYSSQWSLA